MDASEPGSVFLSRVSPKDVSKIILLLKSKYEHISLYSTNVLRLIHAVIAPVLSFIISKSLLNYIFPKSLKVASRIPVYKNGLELDVNNYRPISILPIFSKVIERVIQLYNFLERFNKLHRSQYGFRKEKSTSHAIMGKFESR